MMRASEFVDKVKAGDIDVREHTAKVLEECERIDKESHYFNRIAHDLAKSQAMKLPEGRLMGLAVSIKDNICVRGVESRAGSRILDGYRPLFSATAVQRLVDEGAIVIGKTAQDEFGFGSFSRNVGVGFPIPLNPLDPDRVCGGSSGGCGGITRKASFPHISLAESTGGSIVAPAAFCGVVGLCPTYGRVSRYGLIDYANSLDKIGPMGTSVSDVALGLRIISGHDPKESTSLDAPVDDYPDWVGRGVVGLKVGIIKECFGDGVQSGVQDNVWRAIKRLEDQGVKYEEVSLPLAQKYGVPAYYLIAMSEASTNLAKYCGMRYGVHGELGRGFNEYFSDIRSRNIGLEAKRRIMLGTFARMAGYRDAFYLKALRVRTRIIGEYKAVLKNYGALVSPTMPMVAPKHSEVSTLTPMQNYMMDIMTVGPNLAGLPHMSMNAGMSSGLPVGIMFTADHLDERTLIRLGGALE
jgi:aspartyl-tRNA(Asn)/glutamyl-tRNA(Gln) amidotransferase subunit A